MPLAASKSELTATEARKLLQVSTAKMSELLKNGTLPWRHDPLDGRIRLVKWVDVKKLLAADKRKHRESE